MRLVEVLYLYNMIAPISPHVLELFRVAFCCDVIEGYGQTETCAGLTGMMLGDYAEKGHVGSVVPCSELKLVSVPELDYYAKDLKVRV